MNVLDKITVNSRLEATLAQQLTQQFIWLIASGQLRPGDRLPSLRQLAGHVSISVNTVRSVYQKLEADGLAETRHGAGTHVRATMPAGWRRLPPGAESHGGHHPPFAHESFLSCPSGGYRGDSASRSNDAFCDQYARRPERGMALLCPIVRETGRWDHRCFTRHLRFLTPQCGFFRQPDTGLADHHSGLAEAADYAVTMDLQSVGYQATRHLLEHGHRRAGLITSDPDSANVKPIYAGYCRALQETGLDPDPALTACVPTFDMAAGARVPGSFWRCPDRLRRSSPSQIRSRWAPCA